MSECVKKYLLAFLLFLLCIDAQGQFKVYTRNTRLYDFPVKTTMVVLSGNDLLDLALKNEITKRWRISPFEFCAPEELENIKKNPKYYVLYTKPESGGIIFLYLEKCAESKNISSINSRMTVAKLPLSCGKITTGRELAYVPAMIDIMQHYVEGAMLRDHIVYLKVEKTRSPLAKARRKKIYISRDDLSESIHGKDSIPSPISGFVFTDDFTADSLFNASSKEALIAFCISSSEYSSKSESYQIIVSADRHELFYFKKKKYKKPSDRGFTMKNLQTIHAEHNYKK